MEALMLHLLLPFALLATGTAPPVAFPDTPAGHHAQAWFPAYNGGEAAMRAFMHSHVSAAGLARRPLEQRIALYRDMREARGALTPVAVGSVAADAITLQ